MCYYGNISTLKSINLIQAKLDHKTASYFAYLALISFLFCIWFFKTMKLTGTKRIIRRITSGLRMRIYTYLRFLSVFGTVLLQFRLSILNTARSRIWCRHPRSISVCSMTVLENSLNTVLIGFPFCVGVVVFSFRLWLTRFKNILRVNVLISGWCCYI